MSFINNEQDEAAFAGQVLEGSAQLRQEAGKRESGFLLQSEEDLAVESGHLAVERVGKGTQGGRFAGADVAGDEGGEAFLESESEPALDFLVSVRRKEIVA
jgi:hypothetical protein